MQKQDFVFDRKEEEFLDYWFHVTGNSKTELTVRYMEMCMVEVAGVAYSKKEDVVVVKRLFPFNYDVIIVDDPELRDILISAIRDIDERKF